jgi:hypothetical protein
MKKAIAIVVAVVVLPLLFLFIKEQQKDKAFEIKQMEAQRDHEYFESQQSIRGQILDEQIKYVRLTQGDLAADTYRLCNFSAPSLEKNKQRCAAIRARMERQQAREEKHPTW